MTRAVLLLKGPYVRLAATLRQRHGWTVDGLTRGEVPRAAQGAIARALDLNAVVERAIEAAVPSDIADRARGVEEALGTNLADILCADRHLGIGWVTGGLYHRSRLADRPYAKHLQMVCDVHDALAAFLDEARPDVVCPGQAGCFELALVYAICEARGIPTHNLAFLGQGSYHYWSEGRCEHIPGLARAYAEEKDSPSDGERIDIASINARTRSMLPAYRARGRGWNLARAMARSTAMHAYTTLRGRKRNIGPRLGTKLGMHVRGFLNFHQDLRRPYPRLEDLPERGFVYFPLHYEPEASLNGAEPHFTNQMYAIELLSKSVPAGVQVVVKEHPIAVGNRPRGWVSTVARFPRVTFAHPFESSLALIERALVTATITGGAGLEAALMGRPVLSMGPSYRFNLVDHVVFANDLHALRAALLELRDGARPRAYPAEAAALGRALARCCFQLDAFFYGDDPPEASLDTAADALARVLGRRAPPALAPGSPAPTPSGAP